FCTRQPRELRQVEGHALGAPSLQALGEDLVEQRSSIVEPALQDGQCPEQRPRNVAPRVVELILQLADLREIANCIIETSRQYLEVTDGADRKERPERLILIAQVFAAQHCLSERTVEVVLDGQGPCHRHM